MHDVGVELQIHALFDHLVLQVITQRAVEAAQEQLTAIEQLGIGTTAMEDRGELHRDIATADHQHAPRQGFEIERFIGCDGMFTPRNRRHVGPAASSDQDVLGRVLLALDFDGMGIDQARMRLQQGYAAIHQDAAVDAVQSLDFPVLVGNQGLPVEGRAVDGPAVALCLANVFGVIRAVDQ